LNFLPLIGPIFTAAARTISTSAHEGITAVAIIETSHIIVQSWFGDDGDVYQLDIYSYAPDDVLAFVSKASG
jgi:S-adenosylmethionine/arginine decarboxylase-like enzyme